ncbi:MobQ family relaxase [Yersinia enterocolitica]|nr:conjugal transfer protein [Yersinia enterocolitica]
MAIFHLEFKIVKRSEGMSSCRKAAYHARCKITDDRTGNTYDFSHRTDLFHHQILAPVSAPAHIIESSTTLWNEVERVERQKDGQTARYFDVAIPCELNNEDKIKLVLEYCQNNFVDKGMIADIAFHGLDSNNPHAHVMLTLKPITAEGFGKKNRSWNEKKNVILWREAWSTLTNDYLEAAGTEVRIDHRSIDAQHNEALENAAITLDVEDKALWLAKATLTSRPPMQRIHRAKWNSKSVQENRAAEQAVRDEMKQEAQVTYRTFKDLDQQPVLVAPVPHARTKLKKPSSAKTRTGKRAPVKSKKKKIEPRQDGIFKRFTLLVVDFFKEKFIWAKKKPVAPDVEHDKRIAENYVFDEVLGIYVPRAEFEKRARFNSDDYIPTKEEITRFPSRYKQEKQDIDNRMKLTPSMQSKQTGKSNVSRLRPPGYRDI